MKHSNHWTTNTSHLTVPHVATITISSAVPSSSTVVQHNYTALLNDRPCHTYTRIYDEPKSDTDYDDAVVYMYPDVNDIVTKPR